MDLPKMLLKPGIKIFVKISTQIFLKNFEDIPIYLFSLCKLKHGFYIKSP